MVGLHFLQQFEGGFVLNALQTLGLLQLIRLPHVHLLDYQALQSLEPHDRGHLKRFHDELALEIDFLPIAAEEKHQFVKLVGEVALFAQHGRVYLELFAPAVEAGLAGFLLFGSEVGAAVLVDEGCEVGVIFDELPNDEQQVE